MHKNMWTIAARRKKPLMRALLEALETRALLTADLSGSFLTAPTSVLSGTNQSVTVSLANDGTTAAKGTIKIAFYAALDGEAFDVNTATPLHTISRQISIGAGRSAVITDSALTISAALAAGTYRIYAVIDSSGVIAESDESNNIAQSAVMGVAQPNYDLVTTMAPGTVLPPALLQGTATKATVKLLVTNPVGSTATIPAGTRVQLRLVARKAGGTTADDVLLTAVPLTVNVGGLSGGQSRPVTATVTFPAGLAADTYQVIAEVDTTNGLSETNETNNETILASSLVNGPAMVDEAIAFDALTVIPATIVADGRKLTLKVDVSNLGNVKAPAGQTASVAISLLNVNDSSSAALQTFPITLSGLAPGSKKVFTFSPTIPNSLANGDYLVNAVLTTSAPGDLTMNNAATASSEMTVGAAFFNLEVQPPTVTSLVPAVINGNKASGTVDVTIKNQSNTLLPPGTQVAIALALRPVGAVNNLQDIPLGSAGHASLSNLAQGASKTIRVNANIPATLSNGDPIIDGDYEIVATVTPAALVESTTADNTAVGATITIDDPFVDLAIVSASQTFLTPAAPGSTATGTVTVRNMGNVAVQGNLTIQFFATPVGSVVPVQIGSRAFMINLEPGAVSQPLTEAIRLSLALDGHAATSANITARIDPSFSDARAGNNQMGAGTVIMSSQYVDLAVVTATNPFGSSGVGGATASGDISVANIGSGVGVGVVTVSYYASPTGTLDGNEVLLGSQTASLSLGAAQISQPVPVALTLPSVSVNTTYKIFARLTAELTLDNNPDDNLTSVLGTVTVLAPV